MTAEIDWEGILNGHPIFSKPNTSTNHQSLQLSLSSAKNLKHEDNDGAGPSGRRQVMCMKDSDLILAYGSEIRMASLNDASVSENSQRTYKVLHTPSIDFDVRQICLSPNKKLLAVAGAYRVAVIILPRTGFSKLVTSRIDCKSLQIGQYYHADSLSPIVKIDWHPWGEAGSTLLVMTVDGKVREYDVSIDPDEPCKTLGFVSERRSSYAAVDETEREVASFTFGKGKADWGPLTLYALMKSGDVYAFCPYLPENASIPSSYLHALECFVSAKEEFVAENNGTVDESFSTLYDYQRKYVNSLLKQLPPASPFPSTSRSVSIHAPKYFPGKPTRQGPFLLQPAPPELQSSPGGDATDIAYLTLGSAFTDSDEQEDTEVSSLSSERLGVLLVAFQDGRVDVYLDLEKVEAKWDTNAKKSFPTSSPTLTTYETIDLAVVSSLSSAFRGLSASALELLESNHIVFYPDPLHDDTIYAYHAFGVHVLNLHSIFKNLAAAMKEENEDALVRTIQNPTKTSVQAILNSFSVEQHSTSAITAVVIPNDVYLTYSIFILTSTMRVATFSLTLRAESVDGLELTEKPREALSLPPLPPSSSPPAYVSLLVAQPFTPPPVLSRPMGSATITKVPLPKSHNVKDEINLTPETLRYLGIVAERITGEIHDAVIACHTLKNRCDLQKQEFGRLQDKVGEIVDRTQRLLEPRKTMIQTRLNDVQAEQTKLLARMDRVLQSLIRQASPELNEHETKWFEELQRMKAQVLGIGRYDADSLKARIHQLQSDFDRLMPALKEVAKEEAERKANLEEDSSGAGHSYTRAYEKMSRFESRKMEDAIKHISKLARKLDITGLSSPPS